MGRLPPACAETVTELRVYGDALAGNLIPHAVMRAEKEVGVVLG